MPTVMPTIVPTILLTGAAGYIGSHTWLALLAAGFKVVGLDDFSNSSPRVLDRLARLSGQAPTFERADINDSAAVDSVFSRHSIDAVVHFAAFKSVGESVAHPLRYYRNNVGGLVNVCQAMQRHDCARMVFSSSATVYGDPASLPIREDFPLSATNPYGQTKLIGEALLRDLGSASAAPLGSDTSCAPWQSACLRYFNPVGAHASGLIGEDPRGIPNNLMPFVAQVASGRRDRLQVFGNDWPTADGTGVRDYIHVLDLADGHVAALRHLLDQAGSFTLNLGTGQGHSVLDLVRAYSTASGREIPLQMAPRRPGDIAACWADASLAAQRIGWRATHDLTQMCSDSWRWQTLNPHGFDSP